MRKRLWIVLSLLVVSALACSLSTVPTSQKPGATPQGGGDQPPSDPVNMTDGLASLNSYQLTITIKSTGPDPSESSTLMIENWYSQDLEAGHTQITQSNIPKEGGDPSTNVTEMYEIGNDQCSGSETDWSWTSMAPNEKEILDLAKNMLGFTPLIDNPAFVAQETVNGVPSNHFTFNISGLGVKSGAVVIANQGDYWLAVDGQYIVKYILDIATSVDPQTNVLHEEISIELTQINQPVDISFPQECLDAALVTPTP